MGMAKRARMSGRTRMTTNAASAEEAPFQLAGPRRALDEALRENVLDVVGDDLEAGDALAAGGDHHGAVGGAGRGQADEDDFVG